MVKIEPTTPNMSQHIATRWPNARNILRPTMLRWHVASVWPGLYNRSLFAILTVEACSPMIVQVFFIP